MKTSSENFREKLLRIEAESGIFELEVNGIRLWQYVRWYCLVNILNDITGIAEFVPVNRIIIKENMKMSFKERLSRQQFLLRKKDLIVMNHPRRVKEGNYYRCFVTETLLENLDCSYYVFENDYRGRHFRPTKTKNLKYVEMDHIRKAFEVKNRDTDHKLRLFYEKIIQAFEENDEIALSSFVKKRMLNYIVGGYYEIYWRTIWAKIVFFLVRPKALIVTSPYSPDAGAIIVEAKKQNIKTIEMQHGIYQGHFFYNYQYQGTVDIFPDYIFAYGKNDRDMQRYPISKERIIPVGYPDLEKKANMYKKKKRNNKKVMLFISSREQLIAEYAVELRKDERLKDVRMIYKLHPAEYVQWKETYPQLVNSGLEIISENKHDIYFYLGHSDFVVGTASTALYEATEFDTEIFIIGEGNYLQASTLYENNYAQLITSADMLINKMLDSNLYNKKKESYFKKNAIENMKQELRRIMYEGKKPCEKKLC